MLSWEKEEHLQTTTFGVPWMFVSVGDLPGSRGRTIYQIVSGISKVVSHHSFPSTQPSHIRFLSYPSINIINNKDNIKQYRNGKISPLNWTFQSFFGRCFLSSSWVYVASFTQNALICSIETHLQGVAFSPFLTKSESNCQNDLTWRIGRKFI